MSNAFEEEFEAFAKEHAHIFLPSLDMKEGDEQPLEFHEVYRKYLSKFEILIEDFISANGFTLKAFYQECKEIMDNTELFGSQKFFIETMLATSEYDTFLMLMKSEMRLYTNSNKK